MYLGNAANLENDAALIQRRAATQKNHMGITGTACGRQRPAWDLHRQARR
ncbi:hypothetical protein HP532_07575 [Pseudomonas sp. CrR25]|nr:hypothetical protein [Pseudomonas sp. CrR25]